MKGYKLLKEHDKHFELLHPDGSAFPVAKSGLSETHMQKIRKMAEGGEVGDGSEAAPEPNPFGQYGGYINAVSAENPDLASRPLSDAPLAKSLRGQEVTDTTPQYMSGFQPNADEAAAVPKGEEKTAEQEAPQVNPNTVIPHGGMQQTSAPMPDSGSALTNIQADNDRIIADQTKALQASAAAAQTAAQQQAKIYAEHAEKVQNLEKQTQIRYAQLNKEQKQITQDVVNTKIDPTRVWDNASTGNKIMAGIGILLSGMGSGLTGQPNLAMDVINKTIDRDIDAQKTELGKKQNLLTQNYRKYGDLQQATAATELQLNSIVQGQIAAAAAKASGPQAQAQAQVAIGQLQLKSNEIKQSLAIQGLKGNILNGGQQGGLAPSVAETLFPGRVVNTPMGVKIAKTPEAAKETQTALTSLDTIDKRLDDMLAFAKDTGTTLPGTTNNAVGHSMVAQVIQELGELNGLKRLTDTEVEMRKDQVPDPGAFNTSKAVAQISLLKKFVKEKRNSEYTNNLVGYNPGRPTDRDIPVPGATLTNWKK